MTTRADAQPPDVGTSEFAVLRTQVDALKELVETRMAQDERHLVTLREMYDGKIVALTDLMGARMAAVEFEIKALREERETKTEGLSRELRAVISGHMQSHTREHELMGMVEQQRMTYIESKVATVNQTREQMIADRADLVRRDMLDERFGSLNTVIDLLRKEQIDPLKAWQSNVQGRMAVIIAIGIFVSTIITSLVAVVANVLTGK